jgi:hypothetical protein
MMLGEKSEAVWFEAAWCMRSYHHGLHFVEHAPVLGELAQRIHGLVADALRIVEKLQAACAGLQDLFVLALLRVCASQNFFVVPHTCILVILAGVMASGWVKS